ncbi:hypothetical protein BofuT4_uP034130.1 [Botrytis cinerea T4]|uniref:Uncharacterized protein n=1 Tax=Botryotinia fuckeliana (strain T4) TaxID=999810 RepID=G2Y843_BOTF4|nr:hypothetical protein BofuT4_uP034130.1 [Botrytis cinerea T4]
MIGSTNERILSLGSLASALIALRSNLTFEAEVRVPYGTSVDGLGVKVESSYLGHPLPIRLAQVAHRCIPMVTYTSYAGTSTKPKIGRLRIMATHD